ncbi:hypothetical protein C2I18_26670 [Paenibacillus sp. PK3_47]|uniref:Asp23/Gls24 family envelope stress response protein n=1 Tax=Paenibacillus sp. PK3_47 TaxID=2072642 RepID=UPI00201D6C32|nr:Asp23/Gls24 family envelope stress response protein [Paenibacillus sp. PK3_47]UQZ36798.1 hypothetical protein C2I18_26670 [Paenibacillus sp. PK3_47]
MTTAHSDYIGRVAISNRTITKIAGKAIEEIQEVMALMQGSTKRKNKTDFYKAVNLTIEDGSVSIRIFPVLRLGTPLHEISRKLQHVIKSHVEKMTGFIVSEVHITVSGIVPNPG